jgi:hypothetical protein
MGSPGRPSCAVLLSAATRSVRNLRFEHGTSVILAIARRRPPALIGRLQEPSLGIEEPQCRLGEAAAGDQDAVVRRRAKRDQATIEHPMHGAAQGHPISHRIRTLAGNRSDMCCLDFCAASAVDNLEFGHPACSPVGDLDGAGEGCVANRTAEHAIDIMALEWHRRLSQARRQWYKVECINRDVERLELASEASGQDLRELGFTERSNCASKSPLAGGTSSR